jgi:hypothetical protein
MNLFLQNNIIIYPKNIYIYYLNLINRLPFSNITTYLEMTSQERDATLTNRNYAKTQYTCIIRHFCINNLKHNVMSILYVIYIYICMLILYNTDISAV